MTELEAHRWIVWGQVVFSVLTLSSRMLIVAPYGRHARRGWGPTLPNAVSWGLMDLPAVGVFTSVCMLGEHALELVPLLFLLMWQIHYFNRAVVFPLRMEFRSGQMPLVIIVIGMIFNGVNAYINARWISHFGSYNNEWLGSLPFIIGGGMFLAGWVGNLHADSVLRKLRQSNAARYSIPRGGLYRWVTSPNYMCEIVEWTGWAVATWSTAGLAFAIYTAANLVPRGIHHHRWYRARFANYPSDRQSIDSLSSLDGAGCLLY